MSAAACRGRRGDPWDTDYLRAGQRALSEVRLVQGLADQLGIDLLYLPSYSPNLNLIERVWKFVKAECLRTKYYDNYGDCSIISAAHWIGLGFLPVNSAAFAADTWPPGHDECSQDGTPAKSRENPRKQALRLRPACTDGATVSNYDKFHAAIQQCLDELPSKHKGGMDTLLTHNFQTFENVSLIAA